jgi:biotin-(acetyl-CoA carboxylase) ligase
LELLALDSAELTAEWDRLNLLRDQRVRIRLSERIVTGRVLAIDAEGALCLDEGGEIQRLYAGHVLRA